MSESVSAARNSLVVVADVDEDHVTLISSLVRAAGFEAVVVGDGLAALDRAAGESVAAAILEVDLPLLSGYQVCHVLRHAREAALPIILVSGDRTDSLDRVAGLLVGADAYLTKPLVPDEFLACLRALVQHRRGPVASPRRLTGREHEVLRLLADGLDQDAIAARLVISSKTVATHIEHILAKLDVRSRAQAVAVAFRESLVS